MNEFLHGMLDAVRRGFQAAQIALYDFDELSGTFDILYFRGYAAGSRSELHRRIPSLQLSRALSHREPFWANDVGEKLMLPLYFQEVLEAVILLERFSPPMIAGDPRWSLHPLVSRFIGLFMSSSRLPVNQKSHPISVHDLERAREVQLRYLPSKHPVTDRYEIFGFNRSSALVGGDYFDYFRHSERGVQCIVADACGHGMSAALVMSTFRGLLLSEIRLDPELGTLFRRLNQHLFTDGEIIQYLTTVLLQYDEERRELHYLNAGHFDPMIIHADGSAESLPGGGPPLGMFNQSQYPVGSCATRPGDLLILYTDGLAELRNNREEFFGTHGITSAIGPIRDRPLQEIARDVLQEAARFSQSSTPDDDLTLFLMRFK